MPVERIGLEELPGCCVGDCVVKLIRQFEYGSGYLEGGNERLAVYRDHSREGSRGEQAVDTLRLR